MITMRRRLRWFFLIFRPSLSIVSRAVRSRLSLSSTSCISLQANTKNIFTKSIFSLMMIAYCLYHLSRSDFIIERNSSKSISPFPSASISLWIWSTSPSDGFSLHCGNELESDKSNKGSHQKKIPKMVCNRCARCNLCNLQVFTLWPLLTI